jgi:NAD-dependent dihydropyrimidine dehydrogenase PreA subunit
VIGGASEKTMHGVFIGVEVDDAVAKDPEASAKLEEVCPVDIFATNDDGTLRIVEGSLDECVLCKLCIDAAPGGTVRIVKLYDGTKLES